MISTLRKTGDWLTSGLLNKFFAVVYAVALVVCPATRAMAYDYVVNENVTNKTTVEFGTYNYFSIAVGNNSYVNDTLTSEYNYGVISNDVECTVRIDNDRDFSEYPLGVYQNLYGEVDLSCLLPYDNFTQGSIQLIASRGVSSYFEVVDYFTTVGTECDFECRAGGKHYTNTYVTQDHSIDFSIYGKNLPKTITLKFRARIFVTIEPYSYNVTAGSDINVAYQWRGLKPYTRKTMLDVSHGLDWCSSRAYDLRDIEKTNDTIYEAINDTAAGNVIEGAKQDFVNEAGSLEAGQANIENAADASMAAVDFDKVDLIGQYSQSTSFWMRLVNALPDATGSFWSVLVFGFLIAFLLFILRLVR